MPSNARWMQKVREVLNLPGSPLSLKNGQWKFIERANVWEQLGSRIFDQHLEDFKSAAVAVLTERDPSFELPREERYAASIHGRVLSHSPALRNGIAEGLALLGNKSSALTNCSQGKAENLASLAIREILSDADWMLWGSLNGLLPTLSEASPDEFLNAVEHALRLSPCPFDELFSQEGNGITGGNYLSGLLWALEGLAWDETYLVRVCVILGELASHDPGGNWTNRPSNSLLTIFLPWFPQTLASIEKRQAAIKTLCHEWPEIGWELLLRLLPNQHQSTSGSHKPKWRISIPEDWNKEVTHQEYWEQVSFYADLAVTIAGSDIAKLSELVSHFDKLPKPSFDKLLVILSSEELTLMEEEKRLELWNRITRFTTKHRKFSEADWALNTTLLSEIEEVADKLAPTNPFNLYQHLFDERDSDLYEEKGNWEEQRKRLDDRRRKAAEQILQAGGLKSIFQFIERVRNPRLVGLALGAIASESADSTLIPKLLVTAEQKLSDFMSAYVWSRYWVKGWGWVDELDKESWAQSQLGKFLSYLPFTHETWERVELWLGDDKSEYWLIANVNPYDAESGLDIAVEKLIEHKRPHAAINCLDRMRHEKQTMDVKACTRALLDAVSSDEPSYAMDSYHIGELIKFLQGCPEVSEDELFHVEWAYLPLLESDQEASPKLLEYKLSSEPEFFCELIRLMYRSKKQEESPQELSEGSRTIATNAWRLLHDWKVPPGLQEDGSFNGDHFSSWLQSVKEACKKSGHLEVAMIHVGEVLIHCPADEDGLWINRMAANALNAPDAEDMRSGYRTGRFNSRGVHWVDPSAKPEKEFANDYRQKAENVEDEGFHRLAVTLRSLAKSYEDEAKRILDERMVESGEASAGETK